jgi:hypothetical protein
LIPRMAVDASRPDKCLVFVPLQPTPSRTIRVITRKTSRLGPLLAAALKDAMTKGNTACVHENAELGAMVDKAASSRRKRRGRGDSLRQRPRNSREYWQWERD